MDSLKVTDAASAAVAVAPRVKLEDIEAAIGGIYYTSGLNAAQSGESAPVSQEHRAPLQILTICLIVMRNGFTVIGKSAPASPENFNADLGRQYAYEDAVRQIWPLMGFALRDKLVEAAETAALRDKGIGVGNASGSYFDR